MVDRRPINYNHVSLIASADRPREMGESMKIADCSIEKVLACEETITIPTYAIKGENRNPVFRSQYGVAHIYPYTLLDDIEAKSKNKIYRALVLENKYLKMIVIPDLGGRVYSLFDKLSQREVFYKNSIVKFAPLAIRGAFFSGGLEFSFPVAHAPTTADAVNWDLSENSDGSASISIGGQEHMSGMRWMITLTLYPDRCVLSQDVRLDNPTPIPGRYHYWTNASIDANDQTEFIYPFHRARSYEYAGTASWPFARLDLIQSQPGLLGMEGVPMWPASRLLEPVNFRWQKNMLAQVSIFGRNVEWDFFGAWQHSTNQGYAHCANARDVAGMKLWSWGNADVGVENQSALTDDGSVYAETQCGAMETQLDFDFLAPGTVRKWREWWLPLRGIGGLSCASTEVGARINIIPREDSSDVTLNIGICPIRDLGTSRVLLATPDRVLINEKITISPEKPWLSTRSISSKEILDYPLIIQIFDGTAKEVLNYTLDRNVDPFEQDNPEVKNNLESYKEYYLLGQKQENFDNREQALQAYQKSLELAPDYGFTHYRLGLMLLRDANLCRAKYHFQSAQKAGVAEAQYYLGLIALYEDQLDQAAAAFEKVPAGTPVSVAALLGLGSVSMRKRNWQEATHIFSCACEMDKTSITAATFYGLALRQSNQMQQALRAYQAILSIDPLNLIALREIATLSDENSTLASVKLHRLLADDRQYNLDMAVYYLQAGLSEDALAILEEASKDWSYPMLDYLIGYILHKKGQIIDVEAHYRNGAAANPDLVFPSRIEEVQALQDAIKLCPEDYKAKYYLGIFLFAHDRYSEGIDLWENALTGLGSYDVLYRNLGLAYWQRQGDHTRALTYFEKALALNPENQDIFIYLDDLYKAEGLMDRREQLLDRIRVIKELREDVRKHSITMMVDLGHFEDALLCLLSGEYVPLEMDQSFHEVYVNALVQRADASMKTGKIDNAIKDYLKALEFPKNLGVGKPTTLAQAEVYYLLGCAYEKIGRFQKAIDVWRLAASEYHPPGKRLYIFVQAALDKLSRYSELGFGL
jgi:tetratricopeptide (TPR) repeat protein